MTDLGTLGGSRSEAVAVSNSGHVVGWADTATDSESRCGWESDAILGRVVFALGERLAEVPNVLAAPAPEVESLEFNSMGTKLVVRPYCANADYWQVYFATNRAILLASEEAGWPIPALQQVVRQGEPPARTVAAA